MKTGLITMAICTLFFSGLRAQEVISAAGNHAENEGIQISWTLGEPVIETAVRSSSMLTQGFHQSKLSVTPVFLLVENNRISAYPNPASEAVYIQFFEMPQQNTVAELYAPDGKLTKQMVLTGELNRLNVTDLPSGEYFLRILQKNAMVKSFKVIKAF